MAEEEQEGAADAPETEGEEESGSKKTRLMMIIGVIVLLLIGGGAGLYFSGILGGGDTEEHAEETHEEDGHGGEEEHAAGGEGGHGEEGAEGEGGGSRFLEIPTMIVNLNTEDGTPRYLRLTVQLELANPSQAPAVEQVMPRVIDQFQTYLRELRVKDLRGSAGIYRLQIELLWRVNKAAAPVKIEDVLFQEILIQ